MARFWLALALAVLLLPLASAQEKTGTDQFGDALPDGALSRLGTAHWRPGGAVFALAFAPDGKRLVSAGRGGLSMWDAANGKELRRYAGHKWEVRCMALSRDGKTLASGGSDGTLCLWDTASGKERKRLLGGAGSIQAVAFGPRGKLLAAAADTGMIHLWDAAGERETGKFQAGEGGWPLAFTPDEQHLLVCELGNSSAGVELRKLPGGEVVRRFGQSLHDISVSPDGKTCAVATREGRPVIHDLETGKATVAMAGELPEFDRIRLAFSPDGRTLAAGSDDGMLRLWNAASGKLQHAFKAHAHYICALAFSPDGKVLASAGADQRIDLWDAATGKQLDASDAPDGPLWSAAFSPDGRTAATVGMDGVLRLWESATGKARVSIPMPAGELCSVAWAPSGTLLALGNEFGHLHLFDTETRKSLQALQAHRRRVTCLAFLPDGQALVSGSHDRTLVLWDTKTGKPIRHFKTRDGSPITALALSSDGRHLFSAGTEARVRFWETETGKPAGECEGHTGGVLSVCFSPEARLALSVGRDGMLRLWETASGKERRSLSGSRGWVWSAAWSRDGRVIASGHADGRVTLWDGRSGLRLREMPGHRGAVVSLTFSRDGSRLISTSTDATGLVWDTSTPRLKHPEPVDISAAKTAELWLELASEDAEAAGEAVQLLARSPKQAAALFRQHVQPVSEQELAGLVRDLDSPRFSVRSRAVNRLTGLGRFIEARLRQELSEKPPLEVRRRIEDILDAVTSEKRPAEEVRLLRALEVLEMIGTDAAKAHLKELAGGAAGCDLTHEAKGALERLTNRR